MKQFNMKQYLLYGINLASAWHMTSARYLAQQEGQSGLQQNGIWRQAYSMIWHLGCSRMAYGLQQNGIWAAA